MAVLLAVAPGAGASAITAQSILRGEVDGVVRDAFGEGIPSAGVTITAVDSGVTIFRETNRVGAFAAPMVGTGSYEIFVEALGYIPRVLRGIRVGPGQVTELSVTLVATAVPPQRVDTVEASLAGASRYDAGGSRAFLASELVGLSDPRLGLDRIASLAPHFDQSWGSEGLPGSLGRVVLDGLPFTAARHPQQGSGDLLPILPRAALVQLDVHRRSDIEWSGAAGSYLAAASRGAGGVFRAEGFASGSSAALWQSESLEGLEKPGFTSIWGGGSVHLPLDADRTRLLVAAEGGSVTIPYPSPVSAALAEELAEGPLPPGVADAGRLAEPWTSELRSFSGLARLDWSTGETTEVAIRGAFGTVQEAGSGALGTPIRYGSQPAYDGTDLLFGASVLAQAHPRVTLEVRAGLDRSTREWSGPAGGGESAPLVPTRFVEDDVLLGAYPGLAGAVSRTGLVASGTAHFQEGPHTMKGGLSASLASHEYRYLEDSAGSYLFSDPTGLAAGDGILRQGAGPVPTRSFSVPEFGIFAQYRWEPTLGVRITAAARYDMETLPLSSIPASIVLDSVAGLRNTNLPSGLRKISPRLSASWDLGGDGRTVIEGSMGAHFDRLDPAALHEVIAHSGGSSYREIVGAVGSDWPDFPSGAGSSAGYRPTLALFGPELQAPRTARASLGLSQRIAASTILHISGVLRRTEFLLRRADLNLALAPSGRLADGRPVYGTLTQIGAIVAPLPGSNRRFTQWSEIRALNPDGVSDYRGMTIAIEHSPSARFDLLASYTYSTTEDNLVGAASGIADARFVPPLPVVGAEGWDQGRSDFDAPHRFAAIFRTRLGLLEGLLLTTAYRFESGQPFTAGYREGVDINGDGSGWNDPAAVPSSLGTLAGDGASCLAQDLGRIATRNGCRGPSTHRIDLHVSAGVLRIGESVGALTIDFFNLLDQEFGIPDGALLLIDPQGAVVRDPATGVTTVPVFLNSSFGEVIRSARPGRLIRVGFSVGMP